MSGYTRIGVAVILASSWGCDSAKIAPPTGLPKPTNEAFVSLQAEKFEVNDVVVFLYVPKGNPPKSSLTHTVGDYEVLKKLTKIKCTIECRILPEPPLDRHFSCSLGIDAPCGPYPNLRHASGAAEFRRLENGKLFAEMEMHQTAPLEVGDKATLALRVRYYTSSHRPVEVDTVKGKLIIKQEE